MKILFVTFNGIEDAAFGGAKASRRNYELLKKYGQTKVYTIRKKSSFRSLCSVLQGYYPPADNADLKSILDMLRDEKYDVVFFDGSHFGKMVQAVKSAGVPVIVFFHNCEYDYIEVRFGQRTSLKKSIYKKVIRKQEGLAAKLADRTVTFTNRDAKRVNELYGVDVTNVIPLSVKDVFARKDRRAKEDFCLLFGPLGHANEEAFLWFVTEVSPKLSCKTVVAGRGFEVLKEQWENENVEVIGTVNDIAQLYADAACVAIPLFSGSGMKIKTAEALMFGKRIFGTDEAYAGYDMAAEGIGTVCNTAAEFVESIRAFLEDGPQIYDPAARTLFETCYSLQASEESFARLLEDF